jgi:hypothetical protein
MSPEEILILGSGQGGKLDGAASRAWRHAVMRPVIFVSCRFARDSPLEGDGFELSVPRQRRHPSGTA